MNEVTVMAPEPEDQNQNLPALRPRMEVGSPMDMSTADFSAALERRKANRKVLLDWIREALVDGVDFGSVATKRGPSKPSLRKPGAEKICGMLNVTPTFPTLPEYEKTALAGVKVESIILRCELFAANGDLVAIGVGARNVAEDDNDLNKALKMAEKSAHIDATLRMAGLSELFTQDLEDKIATEKAAGKAAAPPPRSTQAPVTPPTPGTPWDMKRFEGYCFARLVKVAQGSWAWWKYAAESCWILPTETIEALVAKGCSTSVNVFNLDPKVSPEENRDRAAKAFKMHETAVGAMMGAMAPEEIELAKQAYQSITAAVPKDVAPAAAAPAAPKAAAPPAQPQPAAPAAPTPAPAVLFNCPNCRSSATKESEKYADTRWCEKCGWQWDAQGNYWEAHPFNYALCPIPPRGTKKKDYKPETLGQIGRTDSRRWFGLIMNVTEAKARAGYTSTNGKHYPASKEEIDFGIACELAKKENEGAQNKSQPTPPREPPPPQTPPLEDDNVPF